MKHLLVILTVLATAPSLRAQENPDDSLPALVQLLGEIDDPAFQYDILKGMSDALKGRTNVKMPEKWPAISAKLSQSKDERVRTLAQNLSTLFGDKGSTDALRKIAADKAADPAERNKALTALLDAKPKDLAPLLQQLVADPAVRAAAMRGLAGYEDPNTAKVILAQYRNLSTPQEKLDALNTLASRDEYARSLLAELKAGSIPVKDLTSATIRQLSGLANPDIDAWIKSNYGAVRTTPEDKLADMARLRKIILEAKTEEADRSRGRAVFARTCAQCHTLFGEGAKTGPDLTGSGRADLDYLLTNAVDPNAVVGKDYQVWSIRTKKKRSIVGMVTREDENTVTVQTENEPVILPREVIDKMTLSEFSMMPEGLLQALSRQELIDLIAYLRGPDQVPLPPE